MAEKRMFTMKIIDSDAFLEMPLTAQALYFHLNMRADDDGFVNNPKKICRLIGAREDDLKLLILKAFVLVFESGVIVIKHWRMNNTLRQDRYRPTDYQEELQMLGIKDNKSYTWKNNLDDSLNGCQVVSKRLPSGCQSGTSDIDIDLDKGIDIDKEEDIDTINNKHIVPSSAIASSISNETETIFKLWNEAKITVHKNITADMVKVITKALSLYGVEGITEGIKHYMIIYRDTNYYFKYKWTLIEFLKQSNALPTFLENGDKWLNYINSKQGKKQKENELLNANAQEMLKDFTGGRY